MTTPSESVAPVPPEERIVLAENRNHTPWCDVFHGRACDCYQTRLLQERDELREALDRARVPSPATPPNAQEGRRPICSREHSFNTENECAACRADRFEHRLRVRGHTVSTEPRSGGDAPKESELLKTIDSLMKSNDALSALADEKNEAARTEWAERCYAAEASRDELRASLRAVLAPLKALAADGGAWWMKDHGASPTPSPRRIFSICGEPPRVVVGMVAMLDTDAALIVGTVNALPALLALAEPAQDEEDK